MNKKNISVLYKTLTGKPAMRWAQENELSKFENEIPIFANEFKTLFFDPDEVWGSEDESPINQFLEQRFQNPPQISLGRDALLRENPWEPQSKAQQLPYFPDRDKAKAILVKEVAKEPVENSSKNMPPVKPQKPNPIWQLQDELRPKGYEVSRLEDAPNYLKQQVQSFQKKETTPNKKWEPFSALKGWYKDLFGEKDSSSQQIPQKQMSLPEREERVRQEVDSNYWTKKLDRSNMPILEKHRIEDIFDISNLSPKMSGQLNESLQKISSHPTYNQMLSLLKSVGPVKIECDTSVKNPSYVLSDKTIKIPSEESLKDPFAIAEELTHRLQHVVYGDRVMNNDSNRRAIETEAKMIQDLYITEDNLPGALKVYNGDDTAYNKALIKFIEDGTPLDSNFFQRWGNQMDTIKTNGFYPYIDDKFSPKLFNYFHKNGLKK